MNSKKAPDIDEFIDLLRHDPTENLFNPWWQNDPENDDYSNACEIRRHQLKFYLKERLGHTRFLLIGEALGYQGGHFSGIAMTSERMLLGFHRQKGILPEHVFTSMMPCRTSRVELRQDGFNEPTATIVWSHLLSLGIDPYKFAIWNALPWHPFHKERGMLSNRTPTDAELAMGHARLFDLINLLQPKKVVAVGEKAAAQLSIMGLPFFKVRHPANGGAAKFRDQFSALI
jgi:uracil-DNA glycosylase